MGVTAVSKERRNFIFRVQAIFLFVVNHSRNGRTSRHRRLEFSVTSLWGSNTSQLFNFDDLY